MPWHGEHVCLCACVQSLFLQKVDFDRFVSNRIACTVLPIFQPFKLYNSFVVIVVVKLAIHMGCWVHREQFNVWFLRDIKYSWLDKIAYPIYVLYNSSENPVVKGLT